jgi:RNA polymerase sigma-70 factor (ECF subfamily)
VQSGAGIANLMTPASCARDLESARSGDVSAFAALVRSHQDLVFSAALRMLGSRDAAQDMAQEVFIQLHEKLSAIESSEHLKAWLRRTVTHRSIDHLRRHQLRVAQLPEGDLGDHAPENQDHLLHERLRNSLLQLQPAARAVMVLRYQEDLDPQEIAETLDMPLNTVKSHLKRSLQTLREQFSPDDSREET